VIIARRINRFANGQNKLAMEKKSETGTPRIYAFRTNGQKVGRGQLKKNKKDEVRFKHAKEIEKAS